MQEQQTRCRYFIRVKMKKLKQQQEDKQMKKMEQQQQLQIGRRRVGKE